MRRKAFWLNPRLAGKLALTLCIAAVGIYVGNQALKDQREYDLLARAQQIENYGTEKQATLMRALEVAPDNYQTAYEIGECLRLQGWNSHGYQKLIPDAMKWYERASMANPYDPYSPMRYGMCLDWLDKHDEAAKVF